MAVDGGIWDKKGSFNLNFTKVQCIELWSIVIYVIFSSVLSLILFSIIYFYFKKYDVYKKLYLKKIIFDRGMTISEKIGSNSIERKMKH